MLEELGAGWKSGDWVGYFQTLWQVQATIVGLVYPFVISFVTFLLQRRASGSAQLHIYLSDSGALVAGLSSFALALAMPVQYILIVHWPVFGGLRWASVDTMWFVVNGLLTLWFLFRTVAFIRPDQQQDIVTQYAVNSALSVEVRTQLRSLYLLNSQGLGWLPGKSYALAKKSGGPVVAMGLAGYDRGSAQLIRKFTTRVRVKNVRVILLGATINGWLKRNVREARQRTASPIASAREPALFFPFGGSSEFEEGTVVLCRVENGSDLSKLERLLLRLSISFIKVSSEGTRLTTGEILSELASDARAALLERDTNAFETKYSELVRLHRTLLDASVSTDAQALVASYALLESRVFPFIAMHVGWGRPYLELAKAAVECLPYEAQAIKRMCYVGRHVCNASSLTGQPMQIRERLMSLSVDVYRVIGDWWQAKAGEHLGVAGGPDNRLRLSGPLGAAYESVSTYIVGAWEAVREDLVRFGRGEETRTGDAWKEMLSLAYRHMERTSHLLLASVVRGDECQAEWFSDSMGKWWHQAVSLHNPSYYLLGKTDFLTVHDVPMDWNAIANAFGISENELEFYRARSVDLPGEVCQAALQNAWRDVELVTMLVLISWALTNPDTKDQSLALHIAGGWVAGKMWREGGGGTFPPPQIDAQALLTAFIRQQVSGSFQSGYRGRLDGVVASAAELRREEMVPGRIYSARGFSSMEELIDAQLILLLVFSGTDWRPGASLNRQIAVWTGMDFAKVEDIRRLLSTMVERLRTSGGTFHLTITEHFFAARHATHTVADGTARVINVLEGILESTGAQQAEAEASAPLSEVAILSVAAAASATGFHKDGGGFPISLFQRVSYRPQEGKRFTLNVVKQRRGEFTEPRMAPVAINQNEVFADAIASHVGLILLNDVIVELPARHIHAIDEASYWQTFIVESGRIRQDGSTPILVVANTGQPEWLFQWLYDQSTSESAKPADMHVAWPSKREAGGPLAYINDVALYVAPIPPEESWILSAEAFLSVEFTEFSPGVFVHVALVPDAASANLVDVQLGFERNVVTNPVELVRIAHGPDRTQEGPRP
ncbi:hypothetical protein AYM40_35100 [Paraburkholderia phytofirmans OLGA172]|uniref:Uncharacterized protein n=1 Tax=Paraburkholderia phytofirmans OLGA172 TaxID=1417228 RepID=A0A167WKJ3_9BURK|nr:hypothetical protein [Paraburkholderia phytofirmans]ANB77313.1 hypothetical protein AYM40_35100 [Paraburkholderia phytofirmans OLGA172]